eukprot:7162767-Pyramimonas_sp.AAC.1
MRPPRGTQDAEEPLRTTLYSPGRRFWMGWWGYFLLVAGGRGFAVAELIGPGHGPAKLATRKPKSAAAEPAHSAYRRGRGLMGSWLS